MIITKDFLLNNTKEDKDLREKTIDAIYEDYLDYVKSEKEFFLNYFKESLKLNSMTKNLKPKQANFMASKIYIGLNRKNIRQLFPISEIFDGYETVEFNQNDNTFTIVRKKDDDLDDNLDKIDD